MVKIEQLIRPLNRGFAALSVKYLINDLTLRYYRNIQHDIQLRVIKEKETYYVYARIPSEGNEKYPTECIFYDVLLQLIPPTTGAYKLDNIRDYDVKVFSNIPAFVYTFNHVFFSKRGLIDMPNGYYNTRTVKEKSKVRNPLNLLGIDKSIWFTIFHLDSIKFFKRTNADQSVDNEATLKDFLKLIAPQDKKFDEVEHRIHSHTSPRKKKEDKYSAAEIARLKMEEREKSREAGHAVAGSNKPTAQYQNSLSSNLTSTMQSSMKSDLAIKTAGKDPKKIIAEHEKPESNGGLKKNGLSANMSSSLRRK